MAMVANARSLFGFPDPVNDLAARVVASGVVAMSVAAIVSGEQWLLVPIVYGFWARVLTGPKLSPLGWVAAVLIAPHLGPSRPVPGPPKRFAQGMGAAFSTAALLLWFVFSLHAVAWVALGLLAAAASLEAFLGYCLGCRVFALLMKLGVLPESACPECADLSRRHPQLKKPL
jgi:hypothetical protein